MLQYPQYGFTAQDVQDVLVRYVQLDNPDSYPFDSYHSHAYNELLYFSKGGGIHNINFKEHAIKNNSLHLLSAGDLHWVERSMVSEGFAIVYKDAFLYKLQEANAGINYIEYFNASRVIDFSEKEKVDFSLLLHEIKNNAENELYLFNLIGAFLTKIVLEKNGADGQHKNFADSIVKRFYELMTQRCCERLPAKEYARLLHVSPATLARKLKLATGKTVTEIQLDFLLKEAKRLLIQTDLSLKELSDKLGFLELSHFSNWFKKHAQLPPSHYRS